MQRNTWFFAIAVTIAFLAANSPSLTAAAELIPNCVYGTFTQGDEKGEIIPEWVGGFDRNQQPGQPALRVAIHCDDDDRKAILVPTDFDDQFGPFAVGHEEIGNGDIEG